MRILTDKDALSVLEKTYPDKFRAILAQVPEREFLRAQKEIELFAINQCWADHLMIIESALDEVQVISQARGDPYCTYNRKLIEAFDDLEKHIRSVILEIFDRIVIVDGHIDLAGMGVRGPSSTRTYMVNDGTEQLNVINGLAASSNPVSALLFGFYLFVVFFDKLIKRKK